MQREKFVIIGSNSFSGASFVAYLLKNNAEVIGISRSPQPAEAFLPYKWMLNKDGQFHFYQLDLNQNLKKIMTIIKGFQPDYIVNFAAQGMVAQSWNRPQDWFMTNTVAMINLHEQLRNCNFLKKYVQISTPEVYGNTRGLVKEDTPYNPTTPYAVSKAACDMSLFSFFKVYNFPVVFTRAANVCGPGQQLYRIIPKTIISILVGKKLKLEGGGVSVRSFIHIQDVCEGISRVIQKGRLGEIYHFATERNISIRQLVEMICGILDVTFEDCTEIVPARRGQDAAYLLDTTKARTELGWNPNISLEESIEQTIDWAKRNLNILRTLPLVYIHKQ